MDIMRSQVNMMWINIPNHHVTSFFFWSWIVNFHDMSWQKYMSWFKIMIIIYALFVFFKIIIIIIIICVFFGFFNNFFWRYSSSLYMFHIPYLYMIHQCIYTLHTLMHTFIKVWTQNFMEMHLGLHHQTISKI